MKIKVTLDKESEKQFKEAMKAASEVTGLTTEGGISIIGHYTGLRLAHKIQPYGFKKMASVESSVANQVWRSVRNAQISGDTSGIEQVHRRRRNKKGQVPKTLNTQGQYKMRPYDGLDVEQHAQRKAQNVGMAKASWVDAVETAGIGVIAVPPTIGRHQGKGLGKGLFQRMLFKSVLILESKISYMRSILRNSTIQSSLAQGRNLALKHIEKNLAKAYKQIERQNIREAKAAAKEWEKRFKLPKVS